jgi:hypothetical protein
MGAINDLESKVSRLKDELRSAQEDLTKAKMETSPAKLGTIWSRTHRGKTERGKVVRYGTKYNPETPILRLFKSDGTLGLRESEIPSWGDGWKIEEQSDA